MTQPGFVYILSNEKNTALYTGSVPCSRFYGWYQRIKYQPKTFEAPYVFGRLVYVEIFAEHTAALRREREIKNLSRIMQHRLVTAYNAESEDLLQAFAAEMERLKLV